MFVYDKNERMPSMETLKNLKNNPKPIAYRD